MAYCYKRISNRLFKHASNYQSPPRELTRRLLYGNSHNPVPIPVPPHRFPALPVNDKLLDQLIMDQTRMRMDALNPPKGQKPTNGVTVEEIRKVVRGAQMEAAREKLLGTTTRSCVSYDELVRACEEISGSESSARELARAMDDSGAVIIFGGAVFLRPEMITDAIERMIQPTQPTDSKRKELEQMEKEKALIDASAEKLVYKELWCGLGLLAVQTLGFMRLTFWELSWDVMEPVCFYVTSFYFMAGYAFFLRTSRDPSFEGFFESRFAARQKGLMKKHGFNLEKLNQLKREIGDEQRTIFSHTSCNCQDRSHLFGHACKL